jgi:hypothetical protein
MEESSVNAPSVPMSVGEEFVAWASQYWKLQDRYKNEKAKDPSSRGMESCDSSYVMDCFREKINELIRTRMVNYGIIAD